MRLIVLQKVAAVLLLLLHFMPALEADIIIKTFHDKNNDGIFQTDSEDLIAGLIVAGYDEYGSFFPFLDDGNGTYTLPGLLIANRLRIQVTGYNRNQRQGIAGPSSVFMAENDDIILVPVSTGPLPNPLESGVLIPCYEKGASILKKDSPGFVSFPYTAEGVAAEYGGSGPNPRVDASISQIGSTWGVAYQASRKRAFAATIMKRHVGLGPEGPGGIYIMDYTNGSAQVSKINLHEF